LSVKIEAALKVSLRGDSPAVAGENVNAALELIDPLLAAEDFTTAARILSSTRPSASGDPALAADIQKRIRSVESLRTAHDRLAQQLQKLKMSPDDPAANLAVGSYLCFNKNEWDKGLPMLAKGSDANLNQLAELEIVRPTSAEDVIRLGDRWWDFGAKQPEAIRGEIDQHAASFYRKTKETATGLRRTLMERRIADASVAEANSLSRQMTPQDIMAKFTFPNKTFEIVDDHVTGTAPSLRHAAGSSQYVWLAAPVSYLNFEYGFSIKARWYQIAILNIDGRLYEFSRGHWGNAATLVLDGAEEKPSSGHGRSSR
jgi:hypothetical protein